MDWMIVPMPQFRIDPALFDTFPDVLIGVIVARNIQNQGEQVEALTALRAQVESLPGRITGDLIEHPHIAVWRSAYQQFGVKPKKYPSSIENLVRRVLNGYTIGHINTLVDLYNQVSLKYLLPVGGEDLDQTQGDIVLRFAGEAEPAVKLLGEADARPPYAGEVIYTDDLGAICRRWNWKEADRTKLTPETTRAILVLEALPPVNHSLLQTALADLDALVQQYCGAQTTHHILSRDHLSIGLE
mgnify:FL=1